MSRSAQDQASSLRTCQGLTEKKVWCWSHTSCQFLNHRQKAFAYVHGSQSCENLVGRSSKVNGVADGGCVRRGKRNGQGEGFCHVGAIGARCGNGLLGCIGYGGALHPATWR